MISCAIGAKWRKATPPEIQYGCAICEAALPIWRVFAKLSRGRNVLFDGSLAPVTYRDLRDGALRVQGELDADTVEDILSHLDDIFLECIAEKRKRDERTIN